MCEQQGVKESPLLDRARKSRLSSSHRKMGSPQALGKPGKGRSKPKEGRGKKRRAGVPRETEL